MFKDTRIKVALVMDEFGGLAGMVTCVILLSIWSAICLPMMKNSNRRSSNVKTAAGW